MEQPRDIVVESAESVNLKDQGPLASSSSESARGDQNIPSMSTKALLKISYDMVPILDRLTTPRAPIDRVEKHGAEEFHGTSLEEFDKVNHWLEKLRRVLDEVKCPPEQNCAVLLLQGAAYDWWKLVLRHPLLLDPITWDFFVKEFQIKFITYAYKEAKWKQFMSMKQRNMTVVEYEKEFSQLSKYALESVLIEAFQC